MAKNGLNKAEESRKLSPKDRDILLGLLSNAPEPKAAFEKVSKFCHLDQSDRVVYAITLKGLQDGGEEGDAL